MNYISVCDGIGAAHVAWQSLGWECLGVSEIDPFCNAVVKHHWGFKNFGRLDDYKTIEAIKGHKPDVIIGGTPCQSFSIAGKRGGIEVDHGQLVLWFLHAIYMAKPRYFVWENVPGILSIDHGSVFKGFISTLAAIGYSVEWRVLDAQYFGVPQRRRRVFVVGHPGDRGAREILFETESRSRRVAAGESPRKDNQRAVANCLRASCCLAYGAEADNYVCETVTAKWAKGSGGSSGDECQNLIVSTITNESRGVNDMTPLVAETITAGSRHYAKAGNNAGIVNPVIEGYRVRRFTPLECERAQGFPDDYTLVPVQTFRNGRVKMASDSQRYKAIGNSMAVSVIRWIGERIAKHYG